jgi:hypothetical protein
VVALTEGDPGALAWVSAANCATVVLGLPLALRVGERLTPYSSIRWTVMTWAAAWTLCLAELAGFGPGPRVALPVAAALVAAGELCWRPHCPHWFHNALAKEELRGGTTPRSPMALTVGVWPGLCWPRPPPGSTDTWLLFVAALIVLVLRTGGRDEPRTRATAAPCAAITKRPATRPRLLRGEQSDGTIAFAAQRDRADPQGAALREALEPVTNGPRAALARRPAWTGTRRRPCCTTLAGIRFVLGDPPERSGAGCAAWRCGAGCGATTTWPRCSTRATWRRSWPRWAGSTPAEIMLRRLLWEFRSRREDAEVAATLANLGALAGYREDWFTAHELLQRAVAIKERCYGRDSPELELTRANLAVAASRIPAEIRP